MNNPGLSKGVTKVNIRLRFTMVNLCRTRIGINPKIGLNVLVQYHRLEKQFFVRTAENTHRKPLVA